MGYVTKTEITGHGFRAMARTILHEELGVDRDVIEHQLAHRVPDALGESLQPDEVSEGPQGDDAEVGGLSRPAEGRRGRYRAAKTGRHDRLI